MEHRSFSNPVLMDTHCSALHLELPHFGIKKVLQIYFDTDFETCNTFFLIPHLPLFSSILNECCVQSIEEADIGTI